MSDSTFHFKKFDCKHENSSMKIGVDSVLLGAWADVSGSSILDVGTGCGIIALMCAQRNAFAIINGIDIDENSIAEAKYNFSSSPWSERLKAELKDYNTISLNKYDLIISNPPYFDSGLKKIAGKRLIARHQFKLTFDQLLKKGETLLKEDGRIALIIPYEFQEKILEISDHCGLYLKRICLVRGHNSAQYKRSMMELSKKITDKEPEYSSLILENERNCPTKTYQNLCKEFYLKF